MMILLPTNVQQLILFNCCRVATTLPPSYRHRQLFTCSTSSFSVFISSLSALKRYCCCDDNRRGRCLSLWEKRQYCLSTTKQQRQLSILFYGSDDFSLASLRLLRENFHDSSNSSPVGIKQLEIVTTSSTNQVYTYARKYALPVHTFDTFTVPPDTFDIGVVSSFGRLIQKRSIEACCYGMLNIHASLLPRWRGASPIQHAILANDKVTGLTIMRVAPKRFDVGQIVAQHKLDIVHRVTAVDLKNMLAPIGAQMLWQVLQNLDQYLANAKDQPEDGVTFAPKLKESESEIDWNKMDANEVDRRYRALLGSTFGIYTYWIDGTTIRLYDLVDPDLVARFDLNYLSGCGVHHIPGMVCYHKKRHLLCVAAADGTWSAFRSLTLKGRKKMSALGFYNTFMRPIAKAYKMSKVGRGQKPLFILGKSVPSEMDQHLSTIHNDNDNDNDASIEKYQHSNLVGVHNFDQLESIYCKLKKLKLIRIN